MFSTKTVYNRNSRTSFQKELDAKLKERRSGGYGTGFSDDEAVIDDDNYSDDFDNEEVSSASDDLLKQFATTSNNYSSESDDNVDHSIFMKSTKPDKLTKSVSNKSSISGKVSRNSSKIEPRKASSPTFKAQPTSFSEILKSTKKQKLTSPNYSNDKILNELLSDSKHSKELYSDVNSKKKLNYYDDFSNSVSPKPKIKNELQASKNFDTGEISFNKTLRSPLLDFIKHTEVENKPVPKQRSNLPTHKLYKNQNKFDNKPTNDLIESLLNGMTNEENKEELKIERKESSSESSTSSHKVNVSRQHSRKSSIKSNKSYHSLNKSQKEGAFTKTEKVSLKLKSKEKPKHQQVNSDDSLSLNKLIFNNQSAIDNVLDMFSNERVKEDEDIQLTFELKKDKKDFENNQSTSTAKTTQNICNETAIEAISKTNRINRNKTDKELELEAASTATSEKPKSSKKRKTKLPKNYTGLGSLSAHKTLKSPRPETTSLGTTCDIRQTVYLEWLDRREKEIKEKRVQEKRMLKEEKEKKELEAKEKHEDELAARKHWEKTKKEQQQRKDRQRRKKEQERRREILEKEEERWKNSKKCDAIRRKALEKARRDKLKSLEKERKESMQKEEDKLKKRQESKKEVAKWNQSRGEKWKEDQRKAKVKAEEESKKKEKEKQEKERIAVERYEKWWNKKMNQQPDKKSSLFSEERPAWSPANKLVTSR